MAPILPFAALRYNTEKVRLEKVLTQPYDKITPEMQEGYYAADQHNLVRIELGKPEPGDNDTNNVYTRASRYLKSWREEGVLVADPSPSIYAYSQSFDVPAGTGAAAGSRMERRGFIAKGNLKEYKEKVVYRHEQTLAKPKADRLNLLRATKAHSGQIFMLYSDPQREIDSLIWNHASSVPPTADMTDEYGVLHRLWKISDHALIQAVRDKMADKKLIIADGHHRYETALAYRGERRAQEIAEAMGTGRTGRFTIDPHEPFEGMMMTFVNMDSDGLLILPTHRVVFGVADFSGTKLLKDTQDLFDTQKLGQGITAEAITKTLAEAGAGTTAFVAVTKEGAYLMRLKAGAQSELIDSLTPEQRSLDVVQLHKILLEGVLGISEEAIRNQTHINYIRSAEEAMQRVRKDADVAFLMNPVRIEQMRDVAFSDQVMPQKSTDFYPKLLSGITIYALD